MSGIYFDGLSVIRPQARARIDASGMTPIVIGSANVVMIFGEATGGAPNTVYTFSDPNQAKAVFRSGALLAGAQRAWNPSPSNAGATTIKMVRVNPATKSTIDIKDVSPATLVTLTSLDYGVWTASITVAVGSGSLSGKKITITYGTQIEVYDNLASMASAVTAINALSGLVSAVLVLEGTAVTPSSATAMTGGTEGTTTNTEWQNAFELQKTEKADILCAMTPTASVYALLKTVVDFVNRQSQYPCMAFVGGVLGETIAQIGARTLAINDSVMVYCTPGVKQYNSSGAVVTESLEYTACAVAGLVAGNPVEMPVTYKYLNGLGLEKNYTDDEIDQLDQLGVCAVAFVPNKGYRIAHGQTTWLTDLNNLWREISIRRVAGRVTWEVLQDMETFIGQAGSPTTIASVKSRIASKLDLIKLAGWIVDGVDNAGNPQPAYRNIQVRFNSATSVLYFEFEASPVAPINYGLITGHFTATNIIA